MSLRSALARLLGREELPEGFAGPLDAEERVLALAPLVGGGHVVVTSLGVWLPEGRRVSWHLVSKATWANGAMGLTEADEVETLEGVVLLADRAPRQLRLAEPGRVPQAVHERVTGSVRSQTGTNRKMAALTQRCSSALLAERGRASMASSRRRAKCSRAPSSPSSIAALGRPCCKSRPGDLLALSRAAASCKSSATW